MTTLNLKPIERTSSNNGNHKEQLVCFTITGKIHPHDSVPFYAGSDIEAPGINMSVKSSGFTLANGRINPGNTFDEKIQDFVNRVHSDSFAYVIDDCSIAYIMDLTEFVEFMYAFCYLNRDSKRNGGQLKIKCKKESQKMRDWFQARVSAA